MKPVMESCVDTCGGYLSTSLVSGAVGFKIRLIIIEDALY